MNKKVKSKFYLKRDTIFLQYKGRPLLLWEPSQKCMVLDIVATAWISYYILSILASAVSIMYEGLFYKLVSESRQNNQSIWNKLFCCFSYIIAMVNRTS